jgi:zinc transport system substrate-binding protein
MQRAVLVLLATLATIQAGLLVPAGLPADESVIGIAVSVPPQAFIADRIGGERVAARAMIPPGSAPATYEPSPQQIVALSRARLYVKVGHPLFSFENRHLSSFLARHPRLEVVSMTATATGSRVPRFDISREMLDSDPHVWLSPRVVRSTAQEIEATLSGIDPQHAHEYAANLSRFVGEVDALDRQIRSTLAAARGRRFLVYHPAWGHFAREYGLEQLAVEKDGKEPGPIDLIAVIEEARGAGFEVIFVQEGFSQRSARVIAGEIGARIEPLNPLAYDWLANLRAAAEVIAPALR